MMPGIFTLSRFTLVFAVFLSLSAGTVAAQEVSARCEAALDKIAGEYSKCLLKADSVFATGGDPEARDAAQERCGTRFDLSVTRAMTRYGEESCTPASLVDSIEGRTADYTESVAMEASGTAAISRLFVQSSDGATLTQSTLTLTGVNGQTGWFADRPNRVSGQESTETFVARWEADGPNSFAADPPNADLTCTVDGEVMNQVVVLTNPVLTGDELSYTVAEVPSGGEDTSFLMSICDGDAHLFIDSDSSAMCPEGMAMQTGPGCVDRSRLPCTYTQHCLGDGMDVLLNSCPGFCG